MDRPIVDQHERVLAATVNVAAIFFPYLAPIIGLVVSPKMKFVRYHAARSLLEELASAIVIGILLIASLLYSANQIRHAMEGGFDWSKVNWIGMLLKATITYVLLSIWGILNTIFNIRDAIAALNGQWPTKPKWSERKALKWSGMA